MSEAMTRLAMQAVISVVFFALIIFIGGGHQMWLVLFMPFFFVILALIISLLILAPMEMIDRLRLRKIRHAELVSASISHSRPELDRTMDAETSSA